MHFEIEINYQTGDSFNTYTSTDTVGAVFFDLETAKKALQYIGEFTIFTQARKPIDKEVLSKAQRAKWFLDAKQDWENEHGLYVPVGSAKEEKYQKIDAFWIGYFERINSARIVVHGEDTSIDF